jgi:D-serine deaminase-like pyridoxal phosphate-dependent protein
MTLVSPPPDATGKRVVRGGPATWRDVDTPALLVDGRVLRRNIADMQALADRTGVRLRPHMKTHKCIRIAREQMAAGAAGATAAKLDEAEMLIAGGITDILVAHEIVTAAKIARAIGMSAKAELTLGVDSREGVERLAAGARDAGTVLRLSIEIDSGLERCGVRPQEAPTLARLIDASPSLTLAGVFTHAGHAYAARNDAELVAAAAGECNAVIAAAEAIRAVGIAVADVSVGSTPTMAKFGGRPGITEIRPGNYVFMDGIEVELGVATVERCALTVAAVVVSRPTPTRAVVDAGSKAFGLDRGAHGKSLLDHFGRPLNTPGKLVRLSEEHGVLDIPADSPLRPGDILRILPNHACIVTNLAAEMWVLDGDRIADRWDIDAAKGSH